MFESLLRIFSSCISEILKHTPSNKLSDNQIIFDSKVMPTKSTLLLVCSQNSSTVPLSKNRSRKDWKWTGTSLTLSLLESIMETCRLVPTFQSVDEFLWCDHSNETSWTIIWHDTICFSIFYKMTFGIFLEFWCLALLGVKRVNGQSP